MCDTLTKREVFLTHQSKENVMSKPTPAPRTITRSTIKFVNGPKYNATARDVHTAGLLARTGRREWHYLVLADSVVVDEKPRKNRKNVQETFVPAGVTVSTYPTFEQIPADKLADYYAEGY